MTSVITTDLVNSITASWRAKIGSTGAVDDFGEKMTADSTGVYIMGTYAPGTLNVFTTADVLQTSYVNSGASTDVILVKYSLTGTYLWSTRATSSQADTNCCIATNGKYLYAVISYAAGLNLYSAGGVLAATCSITGASQNTCIVQYNASTGAVVAYTAIASVDNNLHKGITVDGSGVYVSGPYSAASCTVYSSAATPLGAPVSAGTLSVVTATDIFVVKYTQELKMSWMTRIAGAGTTDLPYSICTDSTNVYLTGTYNSATLTVYNGPSGTATTLATLASGTGSSFVVAYACTTGVGVWATRSTATSAPLQGRGITVYNNAVYVCGVFTGTLTSYDAPGTSATMATMASISASQDGYITAYNATTGAVTFQAKMATTGSDTAEDIFADVTGVYVTGGYSGVFSVYDSPGSSVGGLPTFSAVTGNDLYIVKFTSSLVSQWATRMTGAGSGEIGNTVRVVNGDVYCMGVYNSATATFYDPPGATASPGIAVISQTVPASPATGGSDIFIVRYNNSNASTATGNLVVSGSSAVTLTEASISNAMITAGVVDTTKIFPATIQNEDFAAATLATGNIAAGTLTSGNFVTNTITGAQVAVNTITSANILDATILTSNISTATITDAKFAAGSILAGNIVASTVAAVDISGATGSILVGNGTSMTALAIGTTGQALTVTGGTAVWGASAVTDTYSSEVISLASGLTTAIDTTKTHSIVDLDLTEAGDIVGDWRASVTDTGFGTPSSSVCVNSTGVYAVYEYSSASTVTPYNSSDAAGSAYTRIGSTEVLIVAYSLLGSILWQTRMTVPSGARVYQPRIATDDGTRIFVAVTYTNTLTLYSAPGTSSFATLTVTNVGTPCCAFVVYVPSTGAVSQYAKITTNVNGTGVNNPCMHVTNSATANVAVACSLTAASFTGNIGINEGPTGTFSVNIAFTTTTGGGVVVRYRYDLIRLTSRGITGISQNMRLGIHADDASSSVFFGFSHTAAVVVAGAPSGTLLASASPMMDDAIVSLSYASLTTQFITHITRTGGSGAGGQGIGCLFGDASNVYISGLDDYNNTLTIYNGGATTIGASFGTLVAIDGSYVVKFTKSALAGVFKTSVNFVGYLYAGCSDTTGVYLSGYRSGTPITVYDAPGTTNTLSAYTGSNLLFVVKYNTSGIAQYLTGGSSDGVFLCSDSIDTLNGDLYITVSAANGSATTRTFYDPPGLYTSMPTATIPNSTPGQFIVRYKNAVLPEGGWRSTVGGTLIEGSTVFNPRTCSDYSGVYMINTTTSATCGLYSTADVIYANAPARVGTQDCILVKYNSSGVIQWYTRFASTGAVLTHFYGTALVSDGKYLYVGLCLNSGTAAAILLYNAVAPGTALGASVASTPATFVSAIIRLRCDTGAISIYAGTSRGHLGSSLCMDSSGVYINQKNATSPVTIYNGPTGAATAGSMAVANVFVIVKYDLDLIAQWWTNISNISTTSYTGVCSDGQNVYTVGWMSTGNATINDGPTGSVSTLAVVNSAVSTSLLIVGFNCATGVGYWATKIGVTATSFTMVNIAVYNDSVYCLSDFDSTVTAYNAPGSASSGRSVTTAGGNDILIAKYNKNTGANTFLTKIGSTAADKSSAIYVDESGFYVTGDNAAALTYAYDPTGVTQNTTVGPIAATSGFIFKYDFSGNAVWAAAINNSSLMGGVTVYDGNVYIAGYVDTTAGVILDPGLLTSQLASIPVVGSTDAFMLKFETTSVSGHLTIANGSASSLIHDVMLRAYTVYNSNVYTNLKMTMTTAVDATAGAAITTVIMPSKGASVSLAWNGSYWVVVSESDFVKVL